MKMFKKATTGSDQITITTSVTFGPAYLAGQGENFRKLIRAIPSLFKDGLNSTQECMEIAAELEGGSKTRSDEIAKLKREIASLNELLALEREEPRA